MDEAPSTRHDPGAGSGLNSEPRWMSSGVAVKLQMHRCNGVPITLPRAIPNVPYVRRICPKRVWHLSPVPPSVAEPTPNEPGGRGPLPEHVGAFSNSAGREQRESRASSRRPKSPPNTEPERKERGIEHPLPGLLAFRPLPTRPLRVLGPAVVSHDAALSNPVRAMCHRASVDPSRAPPRAERGLWRG
jgi:hypothetical protein